LTTHPWVIFFFFWQALIHGIWQVLARSGNKFWQVLAKIHITVLYGFLSRTAD
jgi:hypothetical protein